MILIDIWNLQLVKVNTLIVLIAQPLNYTTKILCIVNGRTQSVKQELNQTIILQQRPTFNLISAETLKVYV